MHRILTMLEDMLNEQLEFIFMHLGRGAFDTAVGRVKKEISEPLAMRRELVKKYRLDENFYETIRKAERTLKILSGV